MITTRDKATLVLSGGFGATGAASQVGASSGFIFGDGDAVPSYASGGKTTVSASLPGGLVGSITTNSGGLTGNPIKLNPVAATAVQLQSASLNWSGTWRADTAERTRCRRSYIDEVYAAIPVQPFTKEIGQPAARIDSEARKKGSVIPLADLQIGTAALYFGFALGTANPRHFQLIPNLNVKPL